MSEEPPEEKLGILGWLLATCLGLIGLIVGIGTLAIAIVVAILIVNAVTSGGGSDQPPPEMRPYLSAVLRINATYKDGMDEFSASMLDPKTLSHEQWWAELERMSGEGRILVTEYLGALQALDPPNELHTLHGRAVANAEQELALFRRLEQAAQDRDYAETQRILADYFDLSDQIAQLQAEWDKAMERVTE
jgi:hypothetical protein